jgi:hypothetical protein
MRIEVFDILLAMALGLSGGSGIGIIVGYITRNQKNTWHAMSLKERTINIALAVFFCAIFCGGLGYYSLIVS